MKGILISILLIGSLAVTVYILSGSAERKTVTLPVDAGAHSAAAEDQPERTLEIVTLLPKDAIPAIFRPNFISAMEADGQYSPTDLVLGVEIAGDVRAYNIPFLSRHEIVNDTVGGRKIAVTW